ncbi:MAG TPA: hypothetical protein PKC21_01690 [Oligoflexia bacterium]|nr:hypothetical protein [Oligoflexia bacterium]HMR24044.1 hypothetical protein [Oligoflexia bacterium]
MKNKQQILILSLVFFLSSCTTNKILKETNQNLEQLNASIDEKFNKMSQPMNDISRNFAEMSKTINSFSKFTEDDGMIDQLKNVLAQISALDIGNSVNTMQETMEASLGLMEGIDRIGGAEGVMVQLTLGYTLGVQILEVFKGYAGIETEGDIEQYLLAIQTILNSTKDSVNPMVKSIRESIQTLINLKAQEYDLNLNAQIEQAKTLENELLKAESALNEGIAFVEYYQTDRSIDITELSPQQLKDFQEKATQLATFYNQHAKEIASLQRIWMEWPNDNEMIAAVE